MMDLINNEYITLVLVPILIGLLQVIKKAEFIEDKFIPILSLIFGVLLGIVFSGFDLKEGIITGLFIGLSAVGLYSGATNVYEGIVDK